MVDLSGSAKHAPSRAARHGFSGGSAIASAAVRPTGLDGVNAPTCERERVLSARTGKSRALARGRIGLPAIGAGAAQQRVPAPRRAGGGAKPAPASTRPASPYFGGERPQCHGEAERADTGAEQTRVAGEAPLLGNRAAEPRIPRRSWCAPRNAAGGARRNAASIQSAAGTFRAPKRSGRDRPSRFGDDVNARRAASAFEVFMPTATPIRTGRMAPVGLRPRPGKASAADAGWRRDRPAVTGRRRRNRSSLAAG
jgi:hypothetical protein